MNTRSPFQEQLLAELRDVVAEKAATPAPRPGISRRRKATITGAIAVAMGAAVAVVVPVVVGGTTSPAYAVERDQDGSITVRVREYTDPAGLRDRLRDLGVNAVVDFVPLNRQCVEPRAAFAEYDPLLFTSEAPTEGAEGFMRLRPDRIAAGQTLVLEIYYRNDAQAHVSSDRARLATGPVAPCVLVPVPAN
ncbi:hypothetical protein OG948_41355 (plasmid) [Embleya sp. NBC_00888]|uniref:hypothetical protein n=1 Tax=Embleya sp. NBC_00888 TaxID=2975960 RepID=UPI002F90B1B2|nr:hypothetical protein OG948_41355 [Embleya sp. NBC_00888]